MGIDINIPINSFKIYTENTWRGGGKEGRSPRKEVVVEKRDIKLHHRT